MIHRHSISSRSGVPAKGRRLLCRLMALALLAPSTAAASDFSSQGIFYNLLPDGNVEVAEPDEGASYSGDLGIPSLVQYGGYNRQVTGIAERAFARCDGLTSVSLPDGLAYIGDYAFYECGALQEMRLPASLSVIGSRAFAFCGAMKIGSWPTSLTEIGENAFSYCKSLTKISNMATYMRFGEAAFSHCTSITELDLSQFKGTIAEAAFTDCTSLRKVNLGQSLYTVPPSAFADCISLEEVTLPDNLNSIEERAFAGCTSLRELTVPPLTSSIGERAFAGCGSISRITFQSSDLMIDEGAFENLGSLEWLYLKGVVSVADNAFANCTGLEWIEVEREVEEIGSRAFGNCPKLAKIYCHSDRPPLITINTFDTATEQKAELLVFPEAKERYELAAYWNRFGRISATENFPLEVSALTADDAEITVSSDSRIIVTGHAGEVSVSDIAGRIIFSGSAEALSAERHSGGIYIVTAGTSVKKISIRR